MSEAAKPKAYNPLDAYLYGIAGPGNSGFTLRDLFAAFALAGMNADVTQSVTPSRIAIEAYQQADAMLKERAK